MFNIYIIQPMLMNELPNLSNIIHSISVPKQVLETDIDELRESVYLIIDDFISNNIEEYRYKDFAHRIFEHTYHIIDMIYRDTTRFISDKKKVFKPKYGASPLFEHHTTSLVFNDAPLHTRVRSIMVGAMNPRAIACMEDGLIRQVDWLLDQMSEQVDLIKSFAGAIPLEVIGNLFNMPHEERGPLQDWSLAILGALEPTLSQQQLDDGNRAVSEFKTYLKDLVFRRAKNPGDPETDVLTRLMQSEQGQLSEV